MRSTTRRFITNSWLPALLALASAGCVQRAGVGRLLTPADVGAGRSFTAGGPPPPRPAHPPTVRLWRDYSNSVDERVLARIAEELADAIMLHKEQVVGVEVVRFADGANSVWAETPAKFNWGPAPEIPEFTPDLSKAPTNARLFKDAMKDYVEGQRREYEKEKARLLSEYGARVEEQLNKFTEHLLERPKAAAPCTRFTTLAERMRLEDLPHSVLLTDGWADCPDERGRAAEGVALNGRHAIIQLTRHADSQADDAEYLKRKAFLEGLFPASKVVHASMPGQAMEFIFQ
jgi:hypothetical protein